MSIDDNKDYIKNQIEPYLEKKGIDTTKAFKCLNPEHIDNNPSMRYFERGKRVHCFSCGARYDIFDLIMMDYNLATMSNAFKKAYELFNIREGSNEQPSYSNNSSSPANNRKNVANYIKKSSQKLDNTSYFQSRGLSRSVAMKYRLGYDDNFLAGNNQIWEAAIIPTSENSYVARNIDMNSGENNRYRKSKGESSFFNKDALSKNVPVFVVEGEIDALSLIDIGFNAVALGSVNNIDRFAALCRQNRKSKKPIYVCLDADVAGQNAQKTLIEKLQKEGCDAISADILAGYHDINDRFVDDRKAMITDIYNLIDGIKTEEHSKTDEPQIIEVASSEEQEATEEILNADYSLTSTKLSFLTGEKKPSSFLTSGFEKFDDAIGGKLYPGLYTLGALSSMGKTSFLLQFADSVAKKGGNVVFVTLEMASEELIAKSISRLTFKNTKRAVDSASFDDIFSGSYRQRKNSEFDLAIEEYKSYCDNIHFVEFEEDFSLDKVRKCLEGDKGEMPSLVIVDYLQLIYSKKFISDKQNVDNTVLELKRMSREYGAVVFAVSSLNRQSYSKPVVLDSFKESGAIEYSSDVLIGMQPRNIYSDNFNILGYQQNDPREIEFRILKNRRGKSGNAVEMDFYAKYNTFVER